MSEYETIYILKPDLPVNRVERVNERVLKMIGEKQATLLVQKDWGKLKLAYPIGKFQSGHYIYSNYKGEGGLVSDIERILKYEEEVIRFLTVRMRDGEDDGKGKTKRVTQPEEASLGTAEGPQSRESFYSRDRRPQGRRDSYAEKE